MINYGKVINIYHQIQGKIVGIVFTNIVVDDEQRKTIRQMCLKIYNKEALDYMPTSKPYIMIYYKMQTKSPVKEKMSRDPVLIPIATIDGMFPKDIIKFEVNHHIRQVFMAPLDKYKIYPDIEIEECSLDNSGDIENSQTETKSIESTPIKGKINDEDQEITALVSPGQTSELITPKIVGSHQLDKKKLITPSGKTELANSNSVNEDEIVSLAEIETIPRFTSLSSAAKTVLIMLLSINFIQIGNFYIYNDDRVILNKPCGHAYGDWLINRFKRYDTGDSRWGVSYGYERIPLSCLYIDASKAFI